MPPKYDPEAFEVKRGKIGNSDGLVCLRLVVPGLMGYPDEHGSSLFCASWAKSGQIQRNYKRRQTIRAMPS